MLNYFTTTWNFAHPLSKFTQDWLAHPVHKLDHPINPVCKLGNNLSWLLAGYLIARGLYLDLNPGPKPTIVKSLHHMVLLLCLILSLLNFNVSVYLLPFIIIEYFRIY